MSLGPKSTLKGIGVKPTLRCSWLAWNKMIALTNGQKETKTYNKGKHTSVVNYEVSSFGIMHPHDPCHLLDIWVPPQKNSGTRTEPDMSAHADWVVELRDRERPIKPYQLNLWHHSHADMGVFWSGTDIETIEAYQGDGLQWAIVTNMKGEWKVRADMFKPYRFWWDDCEMTVEYPALEGMDAWFDSVKGVIENGHTTSSYGGSHGYGGSHNWHSRGSSHTRNRGHYGAWINGKFVPHDEKKDDDITELDFSSFMGGDLTDPSIAPDNTPDPREVLHLSHPMLQEAYDLQVLSESEALQLELEYLTDQTTEVAMLKAILYFAEKAGVDFDMDEVKKAIDEVPPLDIVDEDDSSVTFGEADSVEDEARAAADAYKHIADELEADENQPTEAEVANEDEQREAA